MKKIAIINDLSGLGRCSLAAQLPIINGLEIEAMPLPTAIFSCQSGFKSYHYTDLTNQIKDSISDWRLEGITPDGIIIGFMLSVAQMRVIDNCIDTLANKDSVILLDPILGDDGKIFSFFSDEYVTELRLFAKKASIITPNITELCILANAKYSDIISKSSLKIDEYINYIATVAKSLLCGRTSSIIVTGIRHIDNKGKEMVYNLFVNETNYGYSGAEYRLGSFSGTGDILAALICGYMLKNHTMQAAIEKTTSFIKQAIDDSQELADKRHYGTNFELGIKNLSNLK